MPTARPTPLLKLDLVLKDGIPVLVHDSNSKLRLRTTVRKGQR